MNTKLLCNYDDALIKIQKYIENLSHNDHTLATKIKKIVADEEKEPLSDNSFLLQIENAIKTGGRDFTGKLIRPIDIFEYTFGSSIKNKLAKINDITEEDTNNAMLQLADYFVPTEILDGFKNTEHDDVDNVMAITERSVSGARMLVNKFEHDHPDLTCKAHINDHCQLLNAVNYIRSYHIFQYVLKKTNENIFGDEELSTKIRMDSLLTLDTPFADMFLKTMSKVTDDLDDRPRVAKTNFVEYHGNTMFQ